MLNLESLQQTSVLWTANIGEELTALIALLLFAAVLIWWVIDSGYPRL